MTRTTRTIPTTPTTSAARVYDATRASIGLIGSIGSAAFVALAAFGCASTPAAPFDTMKNSNLTAFRLQNYEPPTPPPGAAAAPGAPGVIPGLPPEISQWVQQGAQGMAQLLPPGLLPPGMMGGAAGAPPPAAAVNTTPRFHDFRILQQTPVIDSDLKEELGKVLGKDSNFYEKHANCLYAEMGLSFASAPGAPPNDMLISFSCNQVAAKTFAWPFPNTGMKPDTVKSLSEIINKIWPPGT